MSTDSVRSLEFSPRLSAELEARLTTRGRVRLETQIFCSNEVAGTLRVTVARDAPPTAHEMRFVGEHKKLAPINGIFIRHLRVFEAWQGQGFGSHLLHEATKLGRLLGMHVYISTPAANARIRKLLCANGFSENIFWYTPNQSLMVRYIW